jgi:hypothetical protein
MMKLTFYKGIFKYSCNPPHTHTHTFHNASVRRVSYITCISEVLPLHSLIMPPMAVHTNMHFMFFLIISQFHNDSVGAPYIANQF